MVLTAVTVQKTIITNNKHEFTQIWRTIICSTFARDWRIPKDHLDHPVDNIFKVLCGTWQTSFDAGWD
jgi:hypothetical protein